MNLTPTEQALIERLIKHKAILVPDLTTKESIALVSLLHSDYVEMMDVTWNTTYTGNAFKDLSYVQLKLPKAKSEEPPTELPKPPEPPPVTTEKYQSEQPPAFIAACVVLAVDCAIRLAQLLM